MPCSDRLPGIQQRTMSSTPEILTLGLFGLAWLLPNRAGLDVEAEAVVGLYQRPVQGVQFGA
jgi:hypothetical protein